MIVSSLAQVFLFEAIYHFSVKKRKSEKNQASVQLPTKSATELLKLTTLHTRDVCVGISVPLLTESSPSYSLPRHCRQVQSLQVSLPHLSLAVSGNANWPSRAWQEPPHWTSCHMMPSVIVLLKSYSPAVLPLSQSSSPKLLSSGVCVWERVRVCVCARACPPSGTCVGGSRVGGSIRLCGYWRGWEWVEWKLEVPQLKTNTIQLT